MGIPPYSPVFPCNGFNPSRLGDVDGAAGHEAAVDDEQQCDGVELEWGGGEPGAEGEIGEDPALGDAVGHEAIETEGCGDWGALEVLALS